MRIGLGQSRAPGLALPGLEAPPLPRAGYSQITELLENLNPAARPSLTTIRSPPMAPSLTGADKIFWDLVAQHCFSEIPPPAAESLFRLEANTQRPLAVKRTFLTSHPPGLAPSQIGAERSLGH